MLLFAALTALTAIAAQAFATHVTCDWAPVRSDPGSVGYKKVSRCVGPVPLLGCLALTTALLVILTMRRPDRCATPPSRVPSRAILAFRTCASTSKRQSDGCRLQCLGPQ
ncbi:hypothetical protein BDZ90DRAFT_44238 [Jaminaea rosea]|uniref:Uncharacterized protein n=1 Tax=Jaminaea rosea TaxID=1569628 RepID=A0A316UMY7_9BASI|nr:hypothetical protein BDZ90DRAFT_44238 [Jaminaea rosea]PWN26629.1 hypothetical protein BDZ90DRAFT_44238 [Jaminaea rosea]